MAHRQLALDYTKCTSAELQHFARERGLQSRLGEIGNFQQLAQLLQQADPNTMIRLTDLSIEVKAELEQFARDRALHLPCVQLPLGSAQGPACLVKLLQQADKNANFRFIDLIPEMRNAIYRELLTLRVDGSEISCFPAILQTSKAINSEASGILHEDNAIRLDISIKPHPNTLNLRETLRVNGCEEESAPWGSIFEPLDGWPEYLKRYRRFKDRITIDNSCPNTQAHGGLGLDDCVYSANASLYSLSCFLAQGSGIKWLDVKWYGYGGAVFDVDDIVNFMWPICRLCARDTIVLARLQAETCAKIREAMPISAPLPAPSNLVRRFVAFYREAKVMQNHAVLFRIPALRQQEPKERAANVGGIAFQPGLITAEWHEHLATATRSLGKVVKRINTGLVHATFSRVGRELGTVLRALKEVEQWRIGGDDGDDGDDASDVEHISNYELCCACYGIPE